MLTQNAPSGIDVPQITHYIDPSIFTPLYGKRGLVDGDTIVYRCAFAAEHTYYLAETDAGFERFENAREANAHVRDLGVGLVWSRKEIQPVEFACQAAKTTIEAIFTNSRPTALSIYLSGKGNFRDDIAITKPYKGNRDSVAKPTHWRAVRDYLINIHGAEIVNGYEADDALGIEATRDGEGTSTVPVVGGGASFICTNDKDLSQIPGLHYNWVRGEVFTISARDAAYNLYLQILQGDATDNVPGIRGVGDVAARRILDGATSSSDLFERTWNTYLKAPGYGSKQAAWRYFLEQANLVYILRGSKTFGEVTPKIEGCLWHDDHQHYAPPYVPEGV